MSIRNRIHISLLSSQVVAPSLSPSLPLCLSGIPLLPLASYPRGQLDLSFSFGFSVAFALFSVLLPSFFPLPPPSPSPSLLLFLLLSSLALALALASASHLVIICIEKCQSQRAAQPPHDNRSDSSLPPPPYTALLLSECPFCLCLLHFSLSTVTL